VRASVTARLSRSAAASAEPARRRGSALTRQPGISSADPACHHRSMAHDPPGELGRAARPRVCIVTPALPAENNGNGHTASRWAGFLAAIADVEIALDWDGAPCDALIALHAKRSASTIARFAATHAGAPLALVLTGTDLYRDLADGDMQARHSIECASIVVVLQSAALDRLDAAARAKSRVIVQSATACRLAHRDIDPDFVAVGHLRDVKDPATLMRAAVRLARDEPALSIAHIGAGLDAALGAQAEATAAACPGYRWLGARPHGAARRAIARACALVHPSRMEGGANVVIEAVRSGVPVLASRIDGNLGLLGADYDGTFPVGDDAALADLMKRFRHDTGFAAHLAAQCAAREPLFRPSRERAAVRALLRDLLAREPAITLRE